MHCPSFYTICDLNMMMSGLSWALDMKCGHGRGGVANDLNDS